MFYVHVAYVRGVQLRGWSANPPKNESHRMEHFGERRSFLSGACSAARARTLNVLMESIKN